jgi:chromate reductase
MRLFVFAASHRKESINRKLAKLAANMGELQGAIIDFAEYGSFDMPIYDDEMFDAKKLPDPAKRFITHLKEADGLIIASPEYNWSFPGSLKNIIDWASVLEPNPFAGKTTLLLSASPSLRGGAQGLVHLKEPLIHLGIYMFPRLFTLSRAEEAFNEQDELKDTKITTELSQVVAGFLAMTEALKAK